ncbi:hypothetical protein [Sneathiella sp.]|uniref:hypothetical protein n=1 Tax=Sneathiella sp. TaxID=1964365 RepID=UPI0035618071
MTWILAALRELFALFVDDVWFTLAILVWIVLGAFVMPEVIADPVWSGPLLFSGFAVILVVGTWMTAKGRGR